MILLIIMMISSFSFASDECNPGINGRYENTLYDGKYTYQKAYAEIQEPTMEISIPCGTKLIPRSLKLNPTSCISGTFKVINDGASQCYLGKKGSYILIGKKMYISPEQIIRTPGFNGEYILKRTE